MSPQRRTALVSVIAACALIALKLVTAIATHSLGLLSEAVHSGTDLVAALLTFFAVGVSARPADPGHAYGHAKAEHLAALGEAAILVAASLVIAWRALWRLTGLAHGQVDPHWYALVVLMLGTGTVICPLTTVAVVAEIGAGAGTAVKRPDAGVDSSRTCTVPPSAARPVTRTLLVPEPPPSAMFTIRRVES